MWEQSLGRTLGPRKGDLVCSTSPQALPSRRGALWHLSEGSEDRWEASAKQNGGGLESRGQSSTPVVLMTSWFWVRQLPSLGLGFLIYKTRGKTELLAQALAGMRACFLHPQNKFSVSFVNFLDFIVLSKASLKFLSLFFVNIKKAHQ